MKKIDDDYDYLANSASASDCTGLIQSPPESKFQEEAFEDVYNYLPPIVKINEEEK